MDDTITPAVTSRPATKADLQAIGRLGALLVRLHHDFDPQRFIAAKPQTEEEYARYLRDAARGAERDPSRHGAGRVREAPVRECRVQADDDRDDAEAERRRELHVRAPSCAAQRTGSAPRWPALPSTTAALRLSPVNVARFIGEFLNAAR